MKATASRQLSAALGRIPSGLFILTLRSGDSDTGMLASWVQQCSFEPPQVSVAIQRGRSIRPLLAEGAHFALSILATRQASLLAHFRKGFESGNLAFAGVDVKRLDCGLPILGQALAYLKCQVADRHAAGDHELFISEVVSGELLGEGQPMVHVRKNGMHY